MKAKCEDKKTIDQLKRWLDPSKIIQYLKERENEEGGFSFAIDLYPDIEDTYYAARTLQLLDEDVDQNNIRNYLRNVSWGYVGFPRAVYMLLYLHLSVSIELPWQSISLFNRDWDGYGILDVQYFSKETTLSFEKLGKKYGASRQAVHGFCKKQSIKRLVRPKGQHKDRCRFCQKLIQISKKPHSEFISIYTIAKETGGSRGKCEYHLRKLRDKELVGQRFGRLLSKRLEKAYAIYFTKRFPFTTIREKIGIANFQWLIRRHWILGWNVPPSFYNGRERSRIQSETYRKKRKRLMGSCRSP